MTQDQDVDKYPVLASLKHPETMRDSHAQFHDVSNLLGCPEHMMDNIHEELRSDLNPKEGWCLFKI